MSVDSIADDLSFSLSQERYWQRVAMERCWILRQSQLLIVFAWRSGRLHFTMQPKVLAGQVLTSERGDIFTTAARTKTLSFSHTTRTTYLPTYLAYLNPVVINLITMANNSFTPVSSLSYSVVNPIDIELVRKARDVVMATTPLDSLHTSSSVKIQKAFQQIQQTTMGA